MRVNGCLDFTGASQQSDGGDARRGMTGEREEEEKERADPEEFLRLRLLGH